MKRILLLSFCLSVLLPSFSQEETTYSLKETLDELYEQIATLKDDNNKLSNNVKSLEMEVNSYHTSNDSLTSKINNLEEELKKKNDDLKDKNKKIKDLETQISEIDDLRLRYANGLLAIAYKEKPIEKGKELCDLVTTPDLGSNRDNIKYWLASYHFHNQSVKDLLKELQNNPERGKRSKVTAFKTQALKAIETNSYYKESQNKDFKIYYLTNIIDKAKKRIEKLSDEPNCYQIDFSDLIEMLD